MQWLEHLDLGLLRIINQSLSNPFFDFLMPFASGNRFFFPIVILAGLWMIWKGGVRGRACALMLLLIVPAGDGLVSNTVKHAIARPRPFIVHADVNQPGKRRVDSTGTRPAVVKADSDAGRRGPLPGHNSMPSSHASNWAAATMILFVYFRRSWRVMLPLAALVAFSRIYNGVHYPSDVLAGLILGGGYAVAGMWMIDQAWQEIGRRWFPLWWARLPSLVNVGAGGGPAAMISGAPDAPGRNADESRPRGETATDSHWLRLGYLLIGLLLAARLIYIGSGTIQLSEDEAYQWCWSKRLALSYFSKPPMIAYTQFLGTSLWGDTEFGVRFFSPVLSALTSLLLLRFLTPLAGGRAAFVFFLIASTTPLLAVGSVLMTVDPLSVFFWVMAMMAGWRAAQSGSRTLDWLWVGLWMGLGFLSKYTALFQWLCWAVFFVLWKPARAQLGRPGPYLALLVNILAAVPVIIWNAQNDWITAAHVAENAQLEKAWNPRVLEFLGQEFGLLNPFFFVPMIWAMIGFWRRMPRSALARYFFSMGAPVFLVYFAWSFRADIKANWIAPSVLPLFCLMLLYWKDRWLTPGHWTRVPLAMGWVVGALVSVFLHDTNLVGKLVGRPLPPRADPLVRVRSWSETSRLAGELREQLERDQGRPAFLIAEHYGVTGELNFYLPAARTNAAGTFLVYALRSDVPRNQFYFWPGYERERQGQNAIFIRELGNRSLIDGWYRKWLRGEPYEDLLGPPRPIRPPPGRLVEQFESVTDLGQVQVQYRNRVFRTFQIFECRNLQ